MSTPVITPAEPIVEPIVESVAPAVAPAVEPTVLPPVEKWHEYQPVDEHGRPVGGKQRFSYMSTEELVKKLETAHVNSILGMREVKRKQRLGITENTVIPEELDRTSTTIEFKEKPLTVEERYAISQDFTDPAKFDSARDRLLESAIGATPAQLRESLNTQRAQTQQILARQNAEVWLERHPEFYACTENVNTVCDWMVKNGLQPTVKNFEYAQTTMSEAGLLLSSPIVREEQPQPQPVVEQVVTVPKLQEPMVEPTRISEVPPSQSSAEVPAEKRQSQVPSGLNNRVAGSTGSMTPSTTAALTLADVEKMSSEEYRKQITTNPEFVKRVNELEASRPPRPRHR